jgi:hypothetical protein
MKTVLLLCCVVAVSLAATNPTFVIIPDPHLNNTGQPGTWTTQAAWIVANQSAYNIQGIFSTGDWNAAGTAYSSSAPTYLPMVWADGFQSIAAMGKPFGSAIGNHDADSGDTLGGESYRVFVNWAADMQGHTQAQSSYLGAWSGDSYGMTYALKFVEPTTGRRFLILFLELWPRSGALAWAGSILSAYPTWEAIALTHGYMDVTGALATASSTYGPNDYSLTGDAAGTDLETWGAGFPNLQAIFCGHWINTPYHALRTDTATDGHPLYGIFTNYQMASPASQSILLVSIGWTTTSFSIVNTTTGVVDTTSTPDLGVGNAKPWRRAAPVLFPMPGGVQGR